jgi:hypothetical protein
MVYLSFYCQNFTCLEYQQEIREDFLKFYFTHPQNFGQLEEAKDDVNFNEFLSPDNDMSYMSQQNNNLNSNKNPTGGFHPPSICHRQQFVPHSIGEVFNKTNDLPNSSNGNSHQSRSSSINSNCPHLHSFSRNEMEGTSRQIETEKEEESLKNTNTLSVKKQQQRTEVGFITSKRSSLYRGVEGEGMEDKDRSSSGSDTFSGRHSSLISFGRNIRVLNIMANTLYREIRCLRLRPRGLD